MHELKWSEGELARRSGVSQPTVHRIISGDSKSPRYENVLKISQALGLAGNLALVQENGALYQLPSNVMKGPAIKGKVPLISWVKAGELCEAVDNFAPGDAEEWLDCPFPHSENAFCLKVVGMSMYPEYREGEIILIEPKLESLHGDDVVVRTPDGQTTFKRLNSSPDGTYLVALNPDMPNRIINVPEGTVFCGVVIGSWTNRRRR